jgi:hypothetical protein
MSYQPNFENQSRSLANALNSDRLEQAAGILRNEMTTNPRAALAMIQREIGREQYSADSPGRIAVKQDGTVLVHDQERSVIAGRVSPSVANQLRETMYNGRNAAGFVTQDQTWRQPRPYYDQPQQPLRSPYDNQRYLDPNASMYRPQTFGDRYAPPTRYAVDDCNQGRPGYPPYSRYESQQDPGRMIAGFVGSIFGTILAGGMNRRDYYPPQYYGGYNTMAYNSYGYRPAAIYAPSYYTQRPSYNQQQHHHWRH